MKKRPLCFYQRVLAALGAALALVLLLCCLLPGSESASGGTFVLPGPLCRAMEAAGIPVEETGSAGLAACTDSAAAWQSDAAAALPFTESRGGTFVPLYTSTVILAADTSQTAARPDSLSALAALGESVALPAAHIRECLAALSHALGGEKAALRYLEGLQAAGLLRYVQGADAAALFREAPLAILPDVEAAALQLQGHSLFTALPREGSLSMPWGLYIQPGAALRLPADAALLQAGLRLPDGRAPAGLYPADYSAASPITDFSGYGSGVQQLFPRFRRTVLYPRHFTAASGLEHLLSYLLGGVLVTVWGLFLYLRTADPHFQRLLLLQALLLQLWMLLRFARLLVWGSGLLLWYLYYLPLLASPLLFVLACRSAAGLKRRGPGRPEYGLCTVTALLLLLVLTNSLHGLVFRLDWASLAPGRDVYSYGPGYFLTVGWAGLMTGYGFFLLLRRVRQAGTAGAVLAPLSILALLLAYCLSYALGLPAVRESEFSMIFSLFILLLWELCLDAGLFQANRHYIGLFRFARIPMWLLDRQLQTVQCSQAAEPLPPELRRGIMAGESHISPNPEAVYDVLPIRGGYAVWQTDMRRVLALQQALREKNQALAARNRLLEQEAVRQQEAAVLAQRRQAVGRLEAVLSQRLAEIRSLAQTLSGRNGPEEKAVLIRIKLLTGYCKRLGMLTLSGDTAGRVPAGLLGLLLSESGVDAAVSGLEVQVYYAQGGSLPLAGAEALLSLFSRCLLALCGAGRRALFCRLLPQGTALRLVLLLEGDALGPLQREAADFPMLQPRLFCDGAGCTLTAQAEGLEDA